MFLLKWKQAVRVEFLDQAKADLVSIKQYYQENGGASLALKMIQKIKRPTLALKDNPKVASLYELAPGVHRLVVADGLFYVFYRVAKHVVVLHIRRAERAPENGDNLK